MDDGSTKEEWKMVEETKKIMGAEIPVSATCVRVPVFVGHAESINIEFENPITAEDAMDILEEAEGVVLMDRREDGGYITPAEATGEDGVFISRIRQDASRPNCLNMWVVSDNVRKGAALNSVQIAETLIEQFSLISKAA
jgi:aspartate-semialdehyde dehydrogenase